MAADETAERDRNSPLPLMERASLSAEMLAMLRRHVMAVWFPRCLDQEAGGFFCDFDRRWRRRGEQKRMLEFQARQTRAAARLAIAFPHEAQWAETALHGFRYLRDVMWDHRHGGWFWMMGRDGRALEGETKHAHSTAYAVQACAVVHAATGEPAALELAREGYAWFDRHAYDNVHGGYRHWLHRDGTVITAADEKGHDPLGHAVGSKDVNVHGDWIEALTSFLEVDADTAIQSRLQMLADLFLRHLVTEEGALHYACTEDWRPHLTPERLGYHLQAYHRLLTASPFLDDAAAAADAALRLLNHAIARGWASTRGGFRYAGPAVVPEQLSGTSYVERRRLWWVQFEGLRALVRCATRRGTDDAPHVDLLREQWAVVRDQLVDRYFGGVYTICPEDLPRTSRPWGPLRTGSALRKGGIWKDASHECDCLLDCIRTLRDQPVGPLDPLRRDGDAIA